MNHASKVLKFSLLTIALTVLLIIVSFFLYFFNQDIQTKFSNKDMLIENGQKFMDASSYLTNEVRFYVSTEDDVHFENYWNEVNKLKNRDNAFEKMKEIGITDGEKALAERMFKISNDLVPLEAITMQEIKNGNPAAAIAYMYGEAYNQDIQQMHTLKTELSVMLKDRTSIEVARLKLQNKILHLVICIFTIIIITLQIINYFINKEIIFNIDIFTGLFNRRKYTKTVKNLTASKSTSVGIALVDINGISHVNDTYGYEHGDKLILKVVNLLQACFGNNLFRIGDDEFIALLVNESYVGFKENVHEFRNIMKAQSDASVSIGDTWCSDMNYLPEQITHANELMYIDKKNYYTNSQFNKKEYKTTSIAELQKAISNKEYFIVLQPKLQLKKGKIVGAEALVRRRTASGEIVSPAKFIFLYELDGVIPLLDFYVLDATCELLKKWEEGGHTLIPISVNFSRLTILEHNVANKILDVCQKHGVDPQYITIELTEHISSISLENLNEILQSISALGFKISLDDFGREYANLSILSHINFDEVKLDKSLIDNLASKASTSTSIRCIIEMCNAFRPTKIVVEGIETPEQVAKLRELNNSSLIVQGYYFSKPISADDFLEYCKKPKSE